MEIKSSWLFGIGFIIIAASIAFVYLPGQKSSVLELQKLQQTAKNDLLEQRKSCFTKADEDYNIWWDNECKSRKLEKSCSLPADTAIRIDDAKREDKDNCLQLYN